MANLMNVKMEKTENLKAFLDTLTNELNQVKVVDERPVAPLSS